MIKEFNYARVEDYEKVLEKYRKKRYKIVEISENRIRQLFSVNTDVIHDNKLRKLFDIVLTLPEYCGPSIDSVHDCFYDKNWTKGKEIVLLIQNIQKFSEYEGLLRIFLDIYSNSKKSNFKFDVWIFEDKQND